MYVCNTQANTYGCVRIYAQEYNEDTHTNTKSRPYIITNDRYLSPIIVYYCNEANIHRVEGNYQKLLKKGITYSCST